MKRTMKVTGRVRHELMGEGVIRNAADITGDCLIRFDNGILVWCAEDALTLIPETPELDFAVGDTVTCPDWVERGISPKVVKSIETSRSSEFYLYEIALNGTLTRWTGTSNPDSPYHFTKVTKPTTFTVTKEINVAKYERSRRDGYFQPANQFGPNDDEVDAAYREQVGG